MTRWEEPGMTAEEYVRSRWVANKWGSIQFPRHKVMYGSKTPPEMWAKAAIYTAKHEEAIRQKREELKFMAECYGHGSNCGCLDCRARDRIVSVLEGQLEGMLKGWKEN